MNRQHFNEQFLGMCEYFGKDQSESVIQIYWNALKSMPDEDFTKAVTVAVLESTFFPRVVELLKSLPKAAPLQIENKVGLTCCENTKRLMKRYPYDPNRGIA